MFLILYLLTIQMIAGMGVRVLMWIISRIPGSCPARAAAKFALKEVSEKEHM